MPATPTRIGFVLEEWRRAVSETSEVTALFGDLARKTDDPMETFFDSVDDAQIMADRRQALLSPVRRLFSASAKGLSAAQDIVYTTGKVPNGRYVDEERACDRRVLVTEVGYDFEKQQSKFTVWG